MSVTASNATPASPAPPPLRTADETPTRPHIDLSRLPHGATFMRILGVNYVRLRTADQGDIYLTEFGVAFWRHLQPENWYEADWFKANRTRLEGTGTVYRVPTRPLPDARPASIDLVVKWSRVGEDVPLNTFTLERAINAEFNTPFEEFSLLQSLREGEYGPPNLRIRTQKPLAIYVPPERMQLWQTGRSKAKILGKVARHPSVEIDILKSYIMLYGWVDGPNAVDAFNAVFFSQAETQVQLKEFTAEVDADLRKKGFMVADHKPTHLIVRLTDGQIRRRRDGRRAYAIVDYELLVRTPEYDEAVGTQRRHEYFARQCTRFQPRPASAFPPDLRSARVLDVDYVYGATASTQGELWVVGNDPDLFGYFLPERWRQKQVLMSPKNQVYYVQTKDRIHLLWKVSDVGEFPPGDLAEPRVARLVAHGYNGPFEEFSLALAMSRAGVPTIHPRAIYVTGGSGTPGCVADVRRFEAMADLTAPDGRPVMPPDRDYVTIWGYWRGLEDDEACTDAARWTPIDVAQACRAGMITEQERDRLIEHQGRRLAAAGFEDVNLRGEHVLLSYLPGGSFKRDADGEFGLRHCNFSFVRRL